MSYEQKQNTGTLFAVEKRSERSPDYNGTIDVDGKQYWISLWKKKSIKSGDTFLSIALKPKIGSDAKRERNRTPPLTEDEMDRIPF